MRQLVSHVGSGDLEGSLTEQQSGTRHVPTAELDGEIICALPVVMEILKQQLFHFLRHI